jgi:hypothetical protein
MAKLRVKLTFPPDLITQPVIFNMGKEFNVITNIRRANVTRDRGWVVLEISGSDDELEHAVEWTRAQGIRVDPVEGDLIAG